MNERIQKDLADQRERLVNALKAGSSIANVDHIIVGIAVLEGQLKAFTDYEAAEEKREGMGVTTLVCALLRGANDTYSGRTNDIARAMHDGYCKGASSILDN
jgi:hypothetical protein